MTSSSLRTLIVDDEPVARDLIQKLLASEVDINVCASLGSGAAATEAIVKLRPDLVFLDIRMPDLDGLSVIRRLDDDAAPLFILVTAFDEHAVEAFDVRAFDYILKPIDKQRFARALRDARAAVLNRRLLATTQKSVDETTEVSSGAGNPLTHLRIRAGDRLLRPRTATVRFFEASNQYVQVDFGAGAYLLSTESLGSLEEKLDPGKFFRIHRSYIVNARFVASVGGNALKGMFVELQDGRRLPISRRSRDAADRLLMAIGEETEDS